jgi:NAD(P)-dependent dehydrogenase (short-subunit alcohol dehydrogenase family)
VVITGGSSGIGFETAKLFADGGARVLITGRTRATLDSAREQLGGTAVAVLGDAASRTDTNELADRVKAEFGTFDALFVNAGVASVPLLNAGSAVVLTTSVANVKGLPLTSAYAASKAALRSMTRSLARELLGRRIRVNAVSPGPIETGILARSMPAEAAEQAQAEMTAANPMLRFGDPAEVARAVAFLAFDATYTTGAELPVDGGTSQL